MKNFILYGTLGCHLCEVAEHLLVMTLDAEKHQVDLVDIAYDDQLLEQLGESIPVLENELTKEQLKWPFDQEKLQQFVGS